MSPFRNFAFLLSICCLLPLGACSSKNDSAPPSDKKVSDREQGDTKSLPAKPRLTLNCEFPAGARSVAMTRDGKTLVAYGDGKDESAILQIWNLDGPKKIHHLELGRTMASGGSLVAITRDGKNAVVAGQRISIRDLQSGKELSALDSSPLTGQLRVCPDRDVVAAVNIHGIDLHDLRKETRQKLWRASPGSENAECLSEFFDKGQRIAWAIDKIDVKNPNGGFSTVGSVTLWNVPDSKPIRTLFKNEVGIVSIAVSADGKLLAVAEKNSKGIKVLEVEGGKTVHEIERRMLNFRVRGMVFLPDNKTLVYEGPNEQGEKARLALTNVKEGITRTIATGHQAKNAEGITMEVAGLSVSQDGSTLATASDDGTICLWDLKELSLK